MGGGGADADAVAVVSRDTEAPSACPQPTAASVAATPQSLLIASTVLTMPAMAGKFEASDEWHPSTQVVHAGRAPDPHTGAITPAIELSTTFARAPSGELIGEHLYGRYGNPTRSRLEACLATLEGGAAAATFASGCAAAQALMSTVAHGERVVVGHDMYFGVRAQYRQLSARFGIDLCEVDLRDERAVEACFERPVRFVMCESPTNPQMHLVDIARLAARCSAASTPLIVDNTMATPLLQTPLALGATMVMHATTKYLAGHSDVLGGAIITRDDDEGFAAIREMQRLGGAVPSPFDCFLLLRGIATLDVRLQRQTDNAERLAQWLSQHPRVEAVRYPGLPDHPQHSLAQRQMKRPGAMLSVLVEGGETAARQFCGRLTLATRATSLGGVHTLVEHRKPVEGPDSTTPDNLVRVSVGIESIADLERDFERALD